MGRRGGMMRLLARFARRTDGAVMVDVVLSLVILNMMLWAFFLWWSAYNSHAQVDRMAYTVSDLVTRQRGTVLQRSLLDGLDRTAEFILDDDQDAAIRFTQVTLVAGADADDPPELRIDWTYSPCSALPAAAPGPGFSVEDLPLMATGATMIVTDVLVPFESQFALIPSMEFERRVVAIYRFEQSFTLEGAGASSCPG